LQVRENLRQYAVRKDAIRAKKRKSKFPHRLEAISAVVITSAVTSIFTVGITILTLRGNFANWEAQHRIEFRSKLLSEKMTLLRELSETYTQYVNFNVELDYISRTALVKAAMRVAHPGINIDDLPAMRNLPDFPSTQQTRYAHELWSKLGSLTTLTELYFEDEIDRLARNFTSALTVNPPTHSDFDVTSNEEFGKLIEQFRQLNPSRPSEFIEILQQYFAVPTSNPANRTAFRRLLDAMKASIDRDLLR
jgi:hypothetical protein